MNVLEAEVTAQELAALCGVSDRHIRRFAEAGKLTKLARNRYRLADALPVLLEELGEGGDKATELQVERVRKLRAEASLAELELAKEKGLVALLSDTQKVWDAFCVMLRTNMLNIPQRAVISLIGETDERRFKKVLREEIILALNSAAEWKPEADEEDETP